MTPPVDLPLSSLRGGELNGRLEGRSDGRCDGRSWKRETLCTSVFRASDGRCKVWHLSMLSLPLSVPKSMTLSEGLKRVPYFSCLTGKVK